MGEMSQGSREEEKQEAKQLQKRYMVSGSLCLTRFIELNLMAIWWKLTVTKEKGGHIGSVEGRRAWREPGGHHREQGWSQRELSGPWN